MRDNVREVGSWENELEDDEADDAPDDVGNSTLTWNVDINLSRGHWEDVGVLRIDPRSKNGSVPDDIPPAFLMPGYREETLLHMFLLVAGCSANKTTIWEQTKK